MDYNNIYYGGAAGLEGWPGLLICLFVLHCLLLLCCESQVSSYMYLICSQVNNSTT